MTTFLLQLAYQLRHYHMGDRSLGRWGITLAFLAAAAILLLWVLRGMPPVAPLHWAVLGLIVLAGFGLAYLNRWAEHRMYVRFDPEPDPIPPAPAHLTPADKVLVHPTGVFEVEGKSGLYADVLAYWRTFASREHAIMAIIHRSRFLLFGSVPERNLGMWYIFFTPDIVETVVPGALTFGKKRRTGLRVTYRYSPLLTTNRKPPKPITRTIYLGFENEAARQAVWADILVDDAEGRSKKED